MRALRIALAVLGLAAGLYGVWSLREVDWADWWSLLTYLAGGVVLHDFVLAPIVAVIGVLAARTVPDTWRGPLAVAVVVWGTVTLMAVPVLGRFGALADNPTLLDRSYLTSWLVGTAVVLVAVAVAGSVRSARAR